MWWLIAAAAAMVAVVAWSTRWPLIYRPPRAAVDRTVLQARLVPAAWRAITAPPKAIEAAKITPRWDNGQPDDRRARVAVRVCAAGEPGGVHAVP